MNGCGKSKHACATVKNQRQNVDIDNRTKHLFSYGFIIRVIWRLAAATARFAIISLIWVVISGVVEVIFIGSAVYIWSVTISVYVGMKAAPPTGTNGIKQQSQHANSGIVFSRLSVRT